LNPLHLLTGLITLGHTVQVGGRLAVMLYGVYLGASPATVGVLSALFNLINVFTSLHVGRWIDRSGARVPMVAGAGMVTLGCSLGFLWGTIPGLFVLAMVVGTFYNFTFIAQQRLAGQYGRPEDRVKNFSMISLGQSAAGILGPVLAGFAIEHAGFQWTFVTFTAIAAIPFLVLAFGLLVFPPHEPRPPRKEGERRAGTLALIRADRQLRNMNVISLLSSSTWSIVVFLIPLYGTQIGLSASTIGLIIGAFSVATVVIRVVLPWVSRYVTPWQQLILALLVSAVCFLPIPLVTSVALLTFLVWWIGMALGLCAPLSQAILYEASPPGRIGELLGLRVTLLNTSHATMPVISGVIGAAVGIGPVFWIVAGVLCAGAWVTREEWRRPLPERR
jgi:MFS family permease